MEPGGRLCHFDNAPQEGDNVGDVGVAEATHSRRHPAPDAGPCHPPTLPVFAVSNPAMEE